MIIADSWLVYHGCHGSRSHLSQCQFYKKLATELIDLDLSSNIASQEVVSTSLSPFIPLMRIPGKRRTSNRTVTSFTLQKRCKYCSKKTTQMCAKCHVQRSFSSYICDPRTGRSCLAHHRAQNHSAEID